MGKEVIKFDTSKIKTLRSNSRSVESDMDTVYGRLKRVTDQTKIWSSKASREFVNKHQDNIKKLDEILASMRGVSKELDQIIYRYSEADTNATHVVKKLDTKNIF